MKSTRVSDYRSRLANYHKQVLTDHEPLLIPGQEGSVVVLPEQDYENLIETIHILRDKTTMRSLERSRKEVAAKQLSGHGMKEVFSDVMDD